MAQIPIGISPASAGCEENIRSPIAVDVACQHVPFGKVVVRIICGSEAHDVGEAASGESAGNDQFVRAIAEEGVLDPVAVHIGVKTLAKHLFSISCHAGNGSRRKRAIALRQAQRQGFHRAVGVQGGANQIRPSVAVHVLE